MSRTKSRDYKVASFSLDRGILVKFQECCAGRHLKLSHVIDSLMEQFLEAQSKSLKKPRKAA